MDPLAIRNLAVNPMIAFAIVFGAAALLSLAMSRLRLKKEKARGGALKSYGCGEDTKPSAMVQPDYGQFYPFAFFFTILHVTALMVATVPMQTMTTFVIATVYILGAIVGLRVLYRR
jgi:NADH-quinone oxidoreductase subunit A